MNTEPPFARPPAGASAGHGGTCLRAEKFGVARAGTSEDAAVVFDDEGVTVAAVADGVGSAKEGRSAAMRTVAALRENFPARPAHWNAGRVCGEMVRHLNRRWWQEGMARFASPELACTVAIAAFEHDRLFLLNAGDSRIYLWRGGALRQLTVDHRAADPRQSHVLTSALGLAEEATVFKAEAEMQPGDLILLCTDGVTDVLDNAALMNLLADGAGAARIASEAARVATDENRDDVTAVTIQVLGIGARSAVPLPTPIIPRVLKAGQVIDGFTLRHHFRANNRTWLASKEGRSFVLKFVPAAAATDEAALGIFAQEVWHATQLESEFFPAAFVPEQPSVRFYAQEYVHAPTLKKVLADRGPLGPEEAAELGKFLLRAGQFLLSHGFVHGDLKPENILVLPEGQAARFKMVDLGSVAEVFSVRGRAGTPSYLAPERFAEAPLTERTEIFSLGAVLYEALTGRLPYGEIEPFQKPAFGEARPVSQLNPHVPAWFESVVMRAISAQPEPRQQHYSEMLFELENPDQVRPFFPAGMPLLERNPTLFYKMAFLVMCAVAAVLTVLLMQRSGK